MTLATSWLYLTETKVSYNNDTWLVIMLSYIFKFENNI